MQYRFITLLFILISQIALAQPMVEIKLDSTNMMIGEQMKMKLEVKYSDKIKVMMPQSIKLGEKVEILNVRDSVSKISENEFLLTKEMTITSFDSGVYNIATLPIAFKEDGEYWDTIYSKSIQLTVVSPEVDTTQAFATIKDIYQEGLSFKEDILPIILIVLGLIVFIALIWFFSQKKEKIENAEQDIKLPAHIIAFKALNELENKQLWQQGKFKAFYSELSYIMREYLENRFAINALESVTEEILTNLNPFSIEKLQTENLKDILQTADLVKYAKVKPSEEKHQNMMNLSLKFVQETQPIEEEIEDDQSSNY